MKLSLQKKLKSYSMLAGVVIATAPEAKSQIIFTDEDPDIHLSLNNSNYYMDLNADGTSDFYFNVHTGNDSYYVYAGESPLASDGGIVAEYHAYNQPYGSLIGTSIPIDNWDLFNAGYICNWGCSMWGTSNFIAIQMQISGDVHYGYVRFQRITDELPGDYALYEFAVNGVANEAIYAGQLPQPVLYNLETDPILYNSMLGDTAITQTIAIAFPQTKDLESATVKIDTGYVEGEDILEFIDQNGLVGSWDAATGTLSVSGSASVTTYQQALQSVKYRNTGIIPTPGIRAIGFAASNGQPFGLPVSETVIRNIEVSVPTNVLQPSVASASIHLSPNPVADLATLEITGIFSGPVQVQLNDASGRKITEQEFLKTARRLLATINMEDLDPGIYLIYIQTGNEKKIVKVVKE